MNKSVALKLFLGQFDEFLQTVARIFPDNSDIAASQTAFYAIKKTNPRLLLKNWTEYIFAKYSTQIAEGNLTYFLEKDYTADLDGVSDNQSILEAIDRMRTPLKGLTGENLNDVTKCLQNLNTICFTYLSLN